MLSDFGFGFGKEVEIKNQLDYQDIIKREAINLIIQNRYPCYEGLTESYYKYCLDPLKLKRGILRDIEDTVRWTKEYGFQDRHKYKFITNTDSYYLGRTYKDLVYYALDPENEELMNAKKFGSEKKECDHISYFFEVANNMESLKQVKKWTCQKEMRDVENRFNHIPLLTDDIYFVKIEEIILFDIEKEALRLIEAEKSWINNLISKEFYWEMVFSIAKTAFIYWLTFGNNQRNQLNKYLDMVFLKFGQAKDYCYTINIEPSNKRSAYPYSLFEIMIDFNRLRFNYEISEISYSELCKAIKLYSNTLEIEYQEWLEENKENHFSSDIKVIYFIYKDCLSRLETYKKNAEVIKTKVIDEGFNFSPLENQQLLDLAVEIDHHGLRGGLSATVSKYISKNKLGKKRKYNKIAGLLDFRREDRIWTLDGGFPPKVFAALCQTLNLRDKNTDAQPEKFISYENEGF